MPQVAKIVNYPNTFLSLTSRSPPRTVEKNNAMFGFAIRLVQPAASAAEVGGRNLPPGWTVPL
jgi:hypothetical protein